MLWSREAIVGTFCWASFWTADVQKGDSVAVLWVKCGDKALHPAAASRVQALADHVHE